MKIEYAIFQGSRCVGVNLFASSMKEINEAIAELNVGELKFTAHIIAIKAGV
jgi:hypothetical protein